MDTKNQILNAAYALFSQKSYQETSVTDICNACHITKPAFYYHFSEKSDLLFHFYEQTVENVVLKTDSSEDNYWIQLSSCFIQLANAEVSLGANIISQIFVANLTKDHNTFDFNAKFQETCVELISKAQLSKQIKNQQNPTKLFLAVSYMFTGYGVMWAIKHNDQSRVKNFVDSLETILEVS